MVSQGPLFLIGTPSSLVTFGSHCGRKWGQNVVTVSLVIPRQTEVTNRTLGTLLRALINLQSIAWDLLLPHVEFAFNKVPNRTTGVSPFKIVYDLDSPGPLDLIPRPMD